MSDWLLIAFLAIQIVGALVFLYWFPRAIGGWFGWTKRTPITRRDDPRLVFRLVHREDRAAYARIMRRTTAVATRDLGRSFARLGHQIGKTMLPAMERFAAAVQGAFR